MTFIERACDRTPQQNCNTEKWRADQLEKLIEVARFASTWAKDISNFHLQLSRSLLHEIPDLEKDLTTELETRGWTNKGKAPKSKAFKAVLKAISEARGWSATLRLAT